nr:unnamed protein product [Digitaria exilis]
MAPSKYRYPLLVVVVLLLDSSSSSIQYYTSPPVATKCPRNERDRHGSEAARNSQLECDILGRRRARARA